MKILISGPQGSGKTTQAILLAQDLALPLFSTGHFLRKLAKKKSKVGRLVKNHLDAGTLIPDDLVIQLVSDELDKASYTRGFVIEGNPRTLSQAKKFKKGLDLVIELYLSDQECTSRLLKRGRTDDSKTLIKKRLVIYHQQTEPMFEYYRKLGTFRRVDGLGSISKIHKTIVKLVGVRKHAPH